MKTSVEQIDGGRIKLSVTLDAETVDREIARAYRELAKQVKIPGFRPGKAPRNRVDALVGPEYAAQEATEALISTTYIRALDVASLRPVGKLDFEDIEDGAVEGQPFTYALALTPRPELSLKTTDVEIRMVSRDATDAEVDEQVEMTRDRFATLETVEPRAIEVGDFVSISFTSTLDGEEYDGSTLDQYLYETGKDLMPQEFESALIGAKPGDKVTTEFVVEDTGANSEFAGKTMRFEIEINEIKAKQLPEVDEEFAKSVGFDGVEEMRAEIRSYIQSQKDSSYERIRDSRLVAALAENLDGEAPAELVTARRDSLMTDFEERLKGNNLTMEQYFTSTGVNPTQWSADMEIQASLTVSQDLALEALAREKGLAPTEDDLAAEFVEIGEAFQIDADKAREQWAEMGLLTSAADQIARRKALDWLVENANIILDETAV